MIECYACVIMGFMKIELSKIEARLQALIEGSAARLFPSTTQQQDLGPRLVEAMRSGIQVNAHGQSSAPNLYLLSVHPAQAHVLRQNQAHLDELTRALSEAGHQAGLTFASPPVIRVTESPELSPGEFRIVASHSRQELTDTTDVPVDDLQDGEGLPQNAFLIVDGMQIFPLSQGVINIGRRQDNQLIIDDTRISRVHAQLRAIKGRYVIFDLDSSGGTFVNGERIRRSTLYPGDVISLSGVPLVFGQDLSGAGETQDYDPARHDTGSKHVS